MNSRNNKNGTIFIIGAGLAGLSAAVSCVKRGHRVEVYESTNHAGGRCRSYNDNILRRKINNGNHLILNGNKGVQQYLSDIDAIKNFSSTLPASFEFLDINSGEYWSLKPSCGRFPWWIFSPNKRIPHTDLRDYFDVMKLMFASDETIADLVDPSRPIFNRLWQPLSKAVLNTNAFEGSAALIWVMLSKTILKGAKNSSPMLPKTDLTAALIEPAIKYLNAKNSILQYSMRLQSIEKRGSYVNTLKFKQKLIKLNQKDIVILALPPNEISALLPEITVPTKTNPILNIHYKIEESVELPNGSPFMGIIGGKAEWIFRYGDIYSVTISDAVDLLKKSNNEIAQAIWQEVCKILQLGNTKQPACRVIREMRATFSQTPQQNHLRPDSQTSYRNLFLAGDWIKTGLPATIESAVISGQKVAKVINK